MSSISKVMVGLAVVFMLGACGGGGSVPRQDPDPVGGGNPADRVSAVALHGGSLDDVTVTELAESVSLEFRQFASPGKFVRLTFAEDAWPDPDKIGWTIQNGDEDSVVTAVAVNGHTADIGIVAAENSTPKPAALTIELAETEPAASMPGGANLPATAEQLSVTELDSGHVKLDWVQALPGDFDYNGKVELADIAVLAAHLGETVDYDGGIESRNAAYWLDTDHDGLISVADSAAVSANLSTELTGFVIGKNSTEIDPEAPGTISVSAEQSTSWGGNPPAYSVELAGTTETDWSVAAVDSRGRVGALRTPQRRGFDLVATINLFGIELFDFPELGDQGHRPGKIGTRVIEPIDVVNRATISGPVVSSDSIFKFAGLPRDRELLLDINYVPRDSLGTGLPVQLEVGPIASLSEVAEAAATAVPFNLSRGKGIGQLNVDIVFLPSGEGGYLIEVNAISVMPGDTLPSFHHTLLNYSEGVLSFDVNGDDEFEPGWFFPDGDRDNVSDAWIAQNEQLDEYGYPTEEQYSIEATILGVNQQTNQIKLGQITWFDSPVLTDPLVLNYSEGMVIFAPGDPGQPLLTPAELEAGAVVNALFYVLRDPAGTLDDSLWLDQLFLIDFISN